MKVEFNGIFKGIHSEKTVKGNVPMLEILIMKPGFIDEFQEKKSKDQTYIINVFNEKIDQVLECNKDDKVKVTCFLNSVEFTTDRGLQYSLKLNLNKIEKL